ncbi:hypothetical protein PHMEG_0006178 [Phytophthora megakarya]|uniref:Uncharacterized protein n=1 Tax=Phytophthora megakarya TaxID=4795 RepID=A0A225WR80_9STRA|nr:hypothetical protein PHMEG_0006178 [Phytophthora megakarya]
MECRVRVRRSTRRWLSVVMATVALVNVAAATSAASSSADYVMDGATTYCWEVGISIYSNTVDGSAVSIVSAEGDGCPLKLSIAFPTDDVYVYDSVDISWNATERLAANGSLETNTFGLTELSAGLDRISQNYYQITASRLRTCTYGADCNPVTTGSQLTENTTNVPLNFTDGLATFDSSELSFNQPGNYTLLAHLIVPSSTPTTKRYDYAVFLKVQVLSRTGDTATDTTATPYAESTTGDSSSSGMSTQVICVLIIGGIVAVALIVIGFVTLRSKIERNPEANGNKYNNSRKGRGMFGFSSTGMNSGGGVAVVSDGEAEEFAMLSMNEATIREKRGSTYLSALSRGRRSSAAPPKKNGSPIQFAGPMCVDRKGVDNDSFNAGDITPQSVPIETPATGRGNYSLDNTPKNLAPKLSPYDQTAAPPGQILFNDIMEDEVDSGRRSGVVVAARRPNFEESTMSDVTDLNLTAVSERIKQHRAYVEQAAATQSKRDVLTADDLRESETKGPMDINDLLASRVKK